MSYNKESGYGKGVFNSFTPYMGGNVFIVCGDTDYPNYELLQDLFKHDPDGVQRLHDTIAGAVAVAKAYDTIYVIGTYNAGLTQISDYSESITISDTQIGLRIIGAGNNYEGVLWTCETQNDYIITVNANQVLIKNFRLRPNGTTGGAVYLTNDATQQATGFQIEDCLFRSTTQTAGYGIYTQDRLNDLFVKNCHFTDLATFAIKQGGGNNTSNRWMIEDCSFDTSCTAGVSGWLNKSRIKNCQFGEFASSVALATSVTAGAAGCSNNIVSGCTFEANGTIASDGEIIGTATDVWTGSMCRKVSESGYTGGDGFILAPPGI